MSEGVSLAQFEISADGKNGAVECPRACAGQSDFSTESKGAMHLPHPLGWYIDSVKSGEIAPLDAVKTKLNGYEGRKTKSETI
jgi:hypothetical protein